jgi:hypothetical protein
MAFYRAFPYPSLERFARDPNRSAEPHDRQLAGCQHGKHRRPSQAEKFSNFRRS